MHAQYSVRTTTTTTTTTHNNRNNIQQSQPTQQPQHHNHTMKLTAPFSDVLKLAAFFLAWKPGHYFYELLFRQTLALVFMRQLRRLLQEFHVFSS